ncbi:MAG TPA: hypothetical protein VFD65_01455, partial [Chitinophagales bacterium]|nr:hypothetical protein [Chitinophagales bacterium]
MFFRIFPICCTLLLFSNIFGQEVDPLQQEIPTDFLEDLAAQADNEENEFDDNTFLEDLELLSIYKINLNN